MMQTSLSDIDTQLAHSHPASDASADKYMVPALERGLRLLCEFSRENACLGAPELARRLNLPRSTVFRLLTTLENLGFIERSQGGAEFRLGLSVLRLGFEYLSSLELTELGQPLLAQLCAAIGHPCNLVVRDARSVVYVAKVSPATSVLSSSVRVGTRLPAHATVLGRILLQDLSLPEIRAIYPEEHLEKIATNTPPTPLALFNLVEQDRQRGYVAEANFYETGISTIAAPVRDHSGRVIAALGVTVNASLLHETQIKQWAPQVQASARTLSQLLNYQPCVGSAEEKIVLLHARG